MSEINLDDGKIKLNGEWLSTEDLAQKIKDKMQAGDMKFSHLAEALEVLSKTLENTITLKIKLTLSKEQYKILKAVGGESDRKCIQKAIQTYIDIENIPSHLEKAASPPEEPSATAVANEKVTNEQTHPSPDKEDDDDTRFQDHYMG